MCAKTGSLLSILLIVLLHLCDNTNHVEGQICTRTVRYWDDVLETYSRTYSYMIKDPGCWIFCSTVRRVGSYLSSHYVKKLLTKMKSECCPGYKQDGAYNSLKCLPQCSKPCGNGTCVAPEKCLCNKGYTVANATCQPVCSKSCANGTCIAPETCQCLPGYQKSTKNTCTPYCASGCPQESCAGPQTCVCNSGYKMALDNKTCQPVCAKPCLNGTCFAPMFCKCLPKYRVSGKFSCKRHCSSQCPNSTCVEKCVCNPGWQMVKLNNTKIMSCEPVCTEPCQNGTCVAPNTCQCLSGYKLTTNNTCKPFCSNGCSYGTCVAPETCSNNSEWKSIQANGASQ